MQIIGPPEGFYSLKIRELRYCRDKHRAAEGCRQAVSIRADMAIGLDPMEVDFDICFRCKEAWAS